MKKQYWVRFVFADKQCRETDYVSTYEMCRERIRSGFDHDADIRFAYVMTYDSFGECFVDLIRREGAA